MRRKTNADSKSGGGDYLLCPGPVWRLHLACLLLFLKCPSTLVCLFCNGAALIARPLGRVPPFICPSALWWYEPMCQVSWSSPPAAVCQPQPSLPSCVTASPFPSASPCHSHCLAVSVHHFLPLCETGLSKRFPHLSISSLMSSRLRVYACWTICRGTARVCVQRRGR